MSEFNYAVAAEASWSSWDAAFNHSDKAVRWEDLAPRWQAAWREALAAGVAAGRADADPQPSTERVADVDRVLGILDTELPERGVSDAE